MKTIKKQQVRIIDATNAIECEERLNSLLNEVAKCSPHIERDTSRPFLFYVFFTISEDEPENKADEYRLRGFEMMCQECPHFVVPDDKRLVCRCGITHGRAKPTATMCDEGIEAYERMNEGRNQ